MSQYEILQIVDKYGDLKNNGKRLSAHEITDIYNKEIGPIRYETVNVTLCRLRKQRYINFDCFYEGGRFFYYWKKEKREFNGAI